MAIKCYADASNELVFGNLAGHRYIEDGCKKTQPNLIDECSKLTRAEGSRFIPFSLRHCRPARVAKALDIKDSNVIEAALHANERTMRRHYDRWRTRAAKPAK